MKNITNNITNAVYSDQPAPTEQPQPKRKHVFGNRFRKTDNMERTVLHQETVQERQELVDENDRLHAMQVEFKRKKFLGLF